MYFFRKPTTTPASQVAQEIIDLANLLCHRTKVVYVLGLPERNENEVRSKQVNDFLQSVGERILRFHLGSSKLKFCLFVCLSSEKLPRSSTSNLRSLSQ